MVVVIPAYKPDGKMIALIRGLIDQTEYKVVVVNDGSGEDFDPIFAQVPPEATLLRHEVNRGKGAGMKTAMRYILEHMPDEAGVVFADADGQHLIRDIIAVSDEMLAHPDSLVLGSRAFTGKVPLRSRMGNRLTQGVFALATGSRVHDTQTGLRAFSLETARKLSELDGDRYEYEMNMLMYASKIRIPFREVAIETVYLEENRSSHFNVLFDSLRIYGIIFKFIGSSLVGFAVDFLLLWLLTGLTASMGAWSLSASIVLARVGSAFVNYTVNRRLVFEHDGKASYSLMQYAMLAVGILLANMALMNLLIHICGWPLLPAKLVVESSLYIASFCVQRLLIFK